MIEGIKFVAARTSPRVCLKGKNSIQILSPKPVDRRATIDDLTLHIVEVESDAPPAVLLHGIGMDWHVWQAVSRRLAPYFHLYMVDLRGHGESDKPEHGYRLVDYATDIEQLLHQLDLRDVTLIGSSLGALVTVVVKTFPSIVSRRVLVDPPLGSEPSRTTPVLAEIFRIKVSGDEECDQRRSIFHALERHYGNIGSVTLNFMADSWTQASTGVVQEASESPETWSQMADALQAIEVPVLLVRGDYDLGSVLREDDALNALALLPHGFDAHIPGAGHAVHGDKPVEFVKRVLEFVKVQPAQIVG